MPDARLSKDGAAFGRARLSAACSPFRLTCELGVMASLFSLIPCSCNELRNRRQSGSCCTPHATPMDWKIFRRRRCSDCSVNWNAILRRGTCTGTSCIASPTLPTGGLVERIASEVLSEKFKSSLLIRDRCPSSAEPASAGSHESISGLYVIKSEWCAP